MSRKTKLIIAEGITVIDIGHGRQLEIDGTDDIGHRRNVEDIGHGRQLETHGDIGHRRNVEDIGHRRATLDLKEPHLVRRITVQRGSDGNIHLELEE